MSSVRRVVVTGIGLVTPLGCDLESTWSGLVAGDSAVRHISRFDPANLPVRIAAEVLDFDPLCYFTRKDLKKNDRFTQFAVGAAEMAIADSGLDISHVGSDRVGVILGVGVGGINTIEETIAGFLQEGMRKVSPFFVPRLIANMAPGQVAIRLGACGVNYATVSACASGGHAIGEAFRSIRFGIQDAMLAGGTEAGVTPMTIAGFAAMRALSTRNDEPSRASRPFDRQRDGFVIGEGAGVLVLEERQAALRRGARIHAEILGYGANADAFHITSPGPEGTNASRCMALALAEAGVSAAEVGYINAHGTSTEFNDRNETLAIRRLLGPGADAVPVSSIKSMIGHTLGAAGGIEAAVTALTLSRGMIPPTINLEDPDPECDLDYVANVARPTAAKVALSNSFGFGGTNVCLLLAQAGFREEQIG